jgi:polysaccharide pyruvyl transferase WcaK-like protein
LFRDKSEIGGAIVSGRVFRYLAIPEASSFQNIERHGLKRLRNTVRRQVDLKRWEYTGVLRAHYSTFENQKNSNIGDIAVGIAVHQQLASHWSLDPQDIVEVAWGELNSALIDRINDEADVFVIGGSGYLHCGANGQLSPLVQADVPKFGEITAPIATVGIGLNRIIQDNWIEPEAVICKDSQVVMEHFSKAVTYHSVRDSLTRDLLVKSGAENVEVIGDPALHLAKGEKIGSQFRSGNRLRVGINFSLHGPNSQDMLYANVATYATFLKWLKENYDCDLIYCVHSDAEQMIWNILNTDEINMEMVTGGPSDLLAVYSSLDLHICQMMHSAILAMSCGVPTLNLGYDMKNLYLYKLMGLESRCLNIVNIELDDLIRNFDDLHKDRECLNHKIVDKQSLLAAKLSGYLEALAPSLR